LPNGVPPSYRSLEQAAILFGAYEKLNEQTHHKPYPFSQKACGRAIETLRSELDPSALSRSWAKGQAMTLDEAVAFAFSLAEPEETDPPGEAGRQELSDEVLH